MSAWPVNDEVFCTVRRQTDRIRRGAACVNNNVPSHSAIHVRLVTVL